MTCSRSEKNEDKVGDNEVVKIVTVSLLSASGQSGGDCLSAGTPTTHGGVTSPFGHGRGRSGSPEVRTDVRDFVLFSFSSAGAFDKSGVGGTIIDLGATLDDCLDCRIDLGHFVDNIIINSHKVF